MDNNIFLKVKEVLIAEYGVTEDLVSPEKLLEDDLDLDSLDNVELLNSLKDYILEEYTGELFDPSLFKDARTLEDLVNKLEPIWNKNKQ